MAAIPQQADTKWLNQFKATVTKSSGYSRKTHGGGRDEKEGKEEENALRTDSNPPHC